MEQLCMLIGVLDTGVMLPMVVATVMVMVGRPLQGNTPRGFSMGSHKESYRGSHMVPTRNKSSLTRCCAALANATGSVST